MFDDAIAIDCENNSEEYAISSLSFKNIDVTIKNTTILKNFNLHINDGEKIALIGPNGAGKSTVMKLFIDRTDAKGKLFINNKLVDFKSDLTGIISYLPQYPVIFDGTLEDVLFMDDLNEADICAKQYGIREKLNKYFNGSLLINSKTPQCDLRLINFLRTMLLMKERSILLVDEPNESLISKLIENSEGKTLVMATHCLQRDLLSKFDKVINLEFEDDELYAIINAAHETMPIEEFTKSQ